MTADIDQLIAHLETHLEAHLARVETRLIAAVNERATRMIDATTAVIGGLHEELQTNTAALDALSANIVERRAALDERLADQERRIAALADLVAGGAEALDLPPLRDTVAALAARVAAMEARPPAAPRWVIGMIALLALADAAQFAVYITLVWRLL